MSGEAASITYIKGLKMRSEVASGKASTVTIFDVDAQKKYILNDRKKEADVRDIGAFSQEMSQAVSIEGMRASMTPNGQTKSILGQVADGYTIEVAVPATIGGPGGVPMTMLLTGVSALFYGIRRSTWPVCGLS